MDEMEKYRNDVEHRRTDRRLKNNRRREWKDEKPKMFDAGTVFMFLVLIGFFVLLYTKI
jgi:hypothetical protein